MATDIKKTWFEVILKADHRQLTRLLYCTPTPDAGRQRLGDWQVSLADPFMADLLPLATLKKFQVQFGVAFAELTGLPLAIMMLGEKSAGAGSDDRLEIARLLCGVRAESWN